MKIKVFRAIQTTVLTIISILISANNTFAQDMGYIIKAMVYSQTSASAPVPLGYVFISELNCYGASTVTNAVITPPGKSPISMPWDGYGFMLDAQYATQLGMDTAFPNGNYSLYTEGMNYNTTMSISLTGNTYPATPQISNFTAMQGINPNENFTITWNSLGLTSNDFIQISISGLNIDGTVFETPSPFKPGALKGNITSFTIPANTLYPSSQYKGELAAAKIVSIVTNSNPDGTKTVLVSGYVKLLQFPMRTVGTDTNIFVWKKPNFVYFFPDGIISGTNAQYSTPRTLSTYNIFFQAFDTTPTNTIFFTGPAGSGLNNTPNSWYNPPYMGQGWASYSSPMISLAPPTQITGGVYTITYKGVNLKFDFDAPQISSKQIFLVPEFIVGSDGVLKQINWSYVRSDGVRIPPQSFMQRVGLNANGMWGGSLFENWELRPAFTNYVVTNAVVYWNDVASVQIGFVDDLENNFMTIWRKSSGPGQITITTERLSGTVGEAFSGAFTAVGGMYPYIWSIEYGFLPSGLYLDDLSGTIWGTPSESGSFKINVRVEDALNQTASKDIILQIAPGTFAHRPAFTNMTKKAGLPAVTLVTLENHFYCIEMSEDLKKWEKGYFFTAESDRTSVTVPEDIFHSRNKLFFRIVFGHKFYADMYLLFFSNAGIINNSPPYNVIVNYPVSINNTRAVFEADFDPDYATLDQVYFGNPINAQAVNMMSRMEADDPGTIGYESPLYNGVLPEGNFSVRYKGTNINFNLNHQAPLLLIIPEPKFTVNNGLLTQISWAYKNPANGNQIAVPSYFNYGSLSLFDNKTNELYRYCITNRNETNHILSRSISWDSIKAVQMQYESDPRTVFIITYGKN